MASCPSCSRNIKIEDSHFGTLFTCPHCQSVFFIGWDGLPENGSQSANPPSFEALPDPFPNDQFPTGDQQASDFITSTPTIEPAPFSADDLLAPLDQVGQENSLEPLDSPKENFQDVLEFANAVENKGLITYTLTIQGIDLSHLHQQLTEALTDSKFNWRVEEVMAQIQNGSLVLESLSPAKAVVLVQRLKFLPLQIHWRQNVLTS